MVHLKILLPFNFTEHDNKALNFAVREENEAAFKALLDGPTEYETYNLGL